LKPGHIVLAWVCFSVFGLAQSTCKPTVDFGNDGSVRVTDCQGKKHVSDPLPHDDPATTVNAGVSSARYPEADAAYDSYLKAFYQYNTSALENRRKVFSWQYYSTIVIFFVVVFLVLAGVVFAALQFRVGLHRHNQNVDTVELSWAKAKVSSSTMGIIILTLSMGFFYLYLKYVYPVSIVTDSPPGSSATAPSK
jgi:hypothetical protein